MPKERLHLLLAEKSRPALPGPKGHNSTEDRISRAYLLGSICPDLLFYDLPTFSLSKLGNSFHRLQGEAGLPFFRGWLDAEGDRLEPDQKAWIFGFVNHLLADGLLHPLIDRYSILPGRSPETLHLSPKHCHLWLESELEAYWVQKLGPADGYLPLLNDFRKEVARNNRYPAMFREFLLRAEQRPVPSLARIRSCMLWQSFLLSRFAGPRPEKWRPWLLAKPFGRYLGALIVPLHSHLCDAQDSPDPQGRPLPVFCEPQFLEQTATALASHWRALAART